MSCVICHTISYLQPRDDPLEQIGASLSLGSKDPQRPISCAIIFEKCKKMIRVHRQHRRTNITDGWTDLQWQCYALCLASCGKNQQGKRG